MADETIYVICEKRHRLLTWCHDAKIDSRSVKQVWNIEMLRGRRLKREQVKVVQYPQNINERHRFYDLLESVYVD